ncbi:MAG TPA: efflux RND transporter periplasmic adaptor subunit [Dyella sp.]|uniref:efflux RND transporter periplasmic adaptor subunit n=1 Tax=Dyella sp. TaxID=1869338 RepID=UPI002F958244
MPWKKFALILAIVVACALGYRFIHSDKGAAKGGGHGSAAGAQQAVPVKVARAVQGDLDLSIKVVGRVEAWSNVTLQPRVSGQLQSLAFAPGAHVRKGDLLVQIDPSLLKAQLDQARGMVARDQAQLVKAQADLNRYTELLAKNFVSRSDFDTFKANLEVAKATLQSDQAAAELAQTQLDYTRIVAPFDAVAGSPLVWPGAQLTANSTNIVVLNQIEPVRVAFNVPEDALASVRAGMARGDVPVAARIPGDKSPALQGKMDFIDNAVDTTTGTIVLKGRFENHDLTLTPGQFVEVNLPTTRLTNVVSVPVEALQSSSNGSFVFVVGANNKVQQRYVTPGTVSGQHAVIDKGLAAGETVVIDGQMLLVDGTAVQVAKGG